MSNDITKKSYRKLLIAAIIILLVIVAGIVIFSIQRAKSNKKQAIEREKSVSSAVADRTFKVQRDDLPIGLIQGGTVNASKKHKLSLRANFGTKLLWIIEENSWVKND